MKDIKTILLNGVLALGLLASAGAAIQQNQDTQALAASPQAVVVEKQSGQSASGDDGSSINTVTSGDTGTENSWDNKGCGDCSACGAKCGVRELR